jgi:DNA-binding MarR family transcriptional regulator
VTTDTIDRIVSAWAAHDPDLDTSPLQVIGRLLLCAHHCERAIAKALAPLGLSFGDFDVINTLRRRADEHGTNPSLLAESSLITTGAMTSRLDRLEQAGLVTRVADPTDRRAVRIRLTRKGRTRAGQALQAVLAADAEFLTPLNGKQRETTAALLKRLLQPWDRAPSPSAGKGMS